MRVAINFWIFLVFLPVYVSSQLLIEGVVKDDLGTPLLGANVIEKGTQNGTITGSNGAFSLEVNSDAILQVSFVGYGSKEIIVGNQVFLEVILDLETRQLGEVLLTGSRNPTRTSVTSLSPIDVIDIEPILVAQPQTSVNDILTYIAPSFNANRQSASDGTEHIDPASLRGLGPDQTLVLVNGKRRHTTSLVNYQNTFGNGSVGTDLNAIPANSIERIEILRDGASAQYGSDAIAGVINIILKADSGLQASVYGGLSDRGDGGTIIGEFSYGTKLTENGGFLNISGRYNKRDRTNRTQNHELIIFDQSSLGNFFAYPFTENPEAARAYDDEQIAAAGLSRDDFNFQVGDAEIEDKQGSFNLNLPTGDKSALYTFANLSVRDGIGFGFRRLPVDVPEGPARELNPIGFQPELASVISDFATTIGWKTLFGEWDADFSYSIGQNKFDYRVNNSANFSLGLESPSSFDSGGHKYLQTLVNADLSRFYGHWWEGLSLAGGFQYRSENYSIREGEPNSYINGGAESFPGFEPNNAVHADRSSWALYGDVEANFTQRFSAALAVRYEGYSDFGSNLNGKISSRFDFSESFGIRATVSTGFRAPSIQQRFFSNYSTNIAEDGIGLVREGIFNSESDVARALNIPGLQEESSWNFTAGLTSKFGNGFRFTLDGYYIPIKDRIVLTSDVTTPEIEALGVSSGRFFTNAIDTETYGADIVLSYTNDLGDGKLDLVFAGNYNKTEIKEFNFPTGLQNIDQNEYFGPDQISLIETNQPRTKATLSANYRLQKLNFFFRGTHFGEVTRDGFPFGVVQKHGATFVVDASIGYDLIKGLNFTAGVNNLFDSFPDEQVFDNSYFGVFKYAPVQQGTVGRFYFGRITYNLP